MDRKKFGQILLENEFISSEALEPFLESADHDGRIGERLVAAEMISSEQQAKTIALQLGLEVFDIRSVMNQLKYFTKYPLKFFREHLILPIDLGDDSDVAFVMSDPLDIEAVEGLRMAYAREWPLRLAVGERGDIEAGLAHLENLRSTSVEDVAARIRHDSKPQESGEEEARHLRDIAEDAPVVRIVDLIINNAVRAGASDIHVERREDELIVRYRVDGVLREVESPPVSIQPAIVSRIKLMAKLNIAERRLPQDGRINLNIDGREIDFRVATTPTIHGENVSIRILDKASLNLDFKGLGFPEDVLVQYKRLIRQPNGMLLVTGPTGSGKTTTLYATLSRLNKPEKKIITLEDPVEYHIDGINQIQVNSKVDLTFASGLRSIVRQDPDILMVGEIRDSETANLAINAAMTGHLVFSTLHTNDAPSAVVRLADLGVEQYLMSSSLRGVLAQRLVRKICPACKKLVMIPDKELADFIKPEGKDVALWEGRGCEKCDGSGTRGRTAIFELLVINSEIQTLIGEKVGAAEIMSLAKNSGMRTLKEDGWRKVFTGVVSVDALREVVSESDGGMNDAGI